MAIFYPSIEKIKQFKVQPTDGERALLNFLYKVLDDSFEVFFNPYLNGDRPDVLIMRKGYGVMIIEVKDWNLANFKLDDKKKWVFIPNNSVVKSPLDQVIKYKSNLYDLHVKDLLYQKIKDFRHFRIVSCAVYFHCASRKNIEDMLVSPYNDKNKDEDVKYQKFLSYNMDFLGYDTLNEEHFTQILKNRYLISKNPSQFFTDALYDNFSRLLSSPLHMKTKEFHTIILISKRKSFTLHDWSKELEVCLVLGRQLYWRQEPYKHTKGHWNATTTHEYSYLHSTLHLRTLFMTN